MKKRNVSIRLPETDIQKIKDISERLRVNESDLFRFAVKNMLAKLIMLSDFSVRGADLIPTWLECGNDLLAHFDIDANRLSQIFNFSDADFEGRVDSDDLDLMILSTFKESYAVKKLSELCGISVSSEDVQSTLRKYLFEKYVLLNGGREVKDLPPPKNTKIANFEFVDA